MHGFFRMILFDVGNSSDLKCKQNKEYFQLLSDGVQPNIPEVYYIFAFVVE